MTPATNSAWSSDPSNIAACRSRGTQVAHFFSLPFRSRNWRGGAGNWQGVGIGSSLDFQDHRAYVPGDDPRYINWFAYARTGQFTMKLYRPEISPAIDLAIDISASMCATEEKRNRVLELISFCLACAARTGAAIRCYTVGHEGARLLDSASIAKLALPDPSRGRENSLRFEAVSWRANAMRVIITDLLFGAHSIPSFRTAFGSGGCTVVFVPASNDEANPPWSGLLELVDIETGNTRVRRWAGEDLKKYQQAYNRHFDLWRSFFRKHHAILTRIPTDGSLNTAFQVEAVASGAVEVLL